jgi:hypothetical protein
MKFHEIVENCIPIFSKNNIMSYISNFFKNIKNILPKYYILIKNEDRWILITATLYDKYLIYEYKINDIKLWNKETLIKEMNLKKYIFYMLIKKENEEKTM